MAKKTKDVDWFRKDAVYRGESSNALADLTAQLASTLAARDSGYRQYDAAGKELATNRKTGLTDVGNSFSSRGISGSGLFAQQADKSAAEFAKQRTDLDTSGSELAQQYGKKGAKVNLGSLKSGAQNGNGNLNKIYGLLGALGVDAGNSYNKTISSAKAASAARSAKPLVQTVKW